MMRKAEYDVPLPPQAELTHAQAVALEMISLLFRIARRSDGAVRVCRNAAEIRAGIDAGALATVLHIEGAEPIDRDFRMLEVLYEAGLRSLGPGLEPAEHFRARRAVPLPELARHRARA